MSKLIWNQVELEKEIQEEAKRRLTQAAIVVRDSARGKVSVSKGDKPHWFRGKEYKPGSLRKSISYRVGYWKRPFTVAGELNVDYKDVLIARIGTPLIYGIFQELGPKKGTKLYKKREVAKIRTKQKKGRRYVYQSKSTVNRWKFQPFLRPAFHETEAQVKNILGVTGNVFVGAGKTELIPQSIILEDKPLVGL